MLPMPTQDLALPPLPAAVSSARTNLPIHRSARRPMQRPHSDRLGQLGLAKAALGITPVGVLSASRTNLCLAQPAPLPALGHRPLLVDLGKAPTTTTACSKTIIKPTTPLLLSVSPRGSLGLSAATALVRTITRLRTKMHLREAFSAADLELAIMRISQSHCSVLRALLQEVCSRTKIRIASSQTAVHLAAMGSTTNRMQMRSESQSVVSLAALQTMPILATIFSAAQTTTINSRPQAIASSISQSLDLVYRLIPTLAEASLAHRIITTIIPQAIPCLAIARIKIHRVSSGVVSSAIRNSLCSKTSNRNNSPLRLCRTTRMVMIICS